MTVIAVVMECSGNKPARIWPKDKMRFMSCNENQWKCSHSLILSINISFQYHLSFVQIWKETQLLWVSYSLCQDWGNRGSCCPGLHPVKTYLNPLQITFLHLLAVLCCNLILMDALKFTPYIITFFHRCKENSNSLLSLPDKIASASEVTIKTKKSLFLPKIDPGTNAAGSDGLFQ